MGVLRKLRRSVSKRIGRERAIRFRLWRTKVKSIRAERRADALLISYPKCGRTWLRMLLSRALATHYGLEDVDYMATDLLGDAWVPPAPRIRLSHDDNPHWKTPGQLATSKARYRRKKIILLARDPRDTVVSMYFERTRREQAYSGSLHDFLHEEKGSLDTLLAYYNIWAAERARPRAFMMVRYEDLKADTAGELRRLLEFTGVDGVTDECIAEAVRFASFDSMRKMETGDVLKSGRLRARDPNDAESFKTRRGKVGGYVDYLDAAQIAWMESRIGTLDPFFGYTDPPATAVAAAGGGTAETRRAAS